MKSFLDKVLGAFKRLFNIGEKVVVVLDDGVNVIAEAVIKLSPRVIKYIELVAPYTETSIDDKLVDLYYQYGLDAEFDGSKTLNELKMQFVRLMVSKVDPIPGVTFDNDLIDTATQYIFSLWKRKQIALEDGEAK